MKIYCFYLVKRKISEDKFLGVDVDMIEETSTNEFVLYAYTPEETCANIFINTRNMNIFYMNILNISREDYIDFNDNNKEQLLEYHIFNTKTIINKRYKTDTIRFLCTLRESDMVLYNKELFISNMISDSIDDEFRDMILRYPFKKEIRKALNKYFLFNEMVTEIYPYEDVNIDYIISDDLSLYISLFGNTYKMKGDNEYESI